jgi:ribonuclease I
MESQEEEELEQQSIALQEAPQKEAEGKDGYFLSLEWRPSSNSMTDTKTPKHQEEPSLQP